MGVFTLTQKNSDNKNTEGCVDIWEERGLMRQLQGKEKGDFDQQLHQEFIALPEHSGSEFTSSLVCTPLPPFIYIC